MGKITNLLKESKSEVKTSTDNDHHHIAEVDGNGNGKTTKTIGEVEEHVHQIEEYDVLEANGHGHSIPNKTPKVNEKD